MTAIDDARATPALATPTIPRVRALAGGRRTLDVLAILLPPVLVLYAFFDKGFAYIRVPGTPIFAGEVLVLVCVAAVVTATPLMHRSLEYSTPAKLLLAFMAWGLLRTAPNIGTYGFNAIRDAALWYYAIVAFGVCTLVCFDLDLVHRWARGYRRVIPWLLAYFPLAVILSIVHNSRLGPIVPGSSVSFWVHKPGNIAVQTTIAVAFLWLVPGVNRRTRVLLTGLGTLVLLIVATQNRAGFLAGIAGLAIVWVLAGRRGRLVLVILSTVVLLTAIAWGLNVHAQGAQHREVSVGQLIQNVRSIGSGNSTNGNLGENVAFRDQLWSGVLKEVRTSHKVLTGLGFGPNIAAQLGFQGQGPDALRSPHNSHLDVFARMGLIGAAIWVALWGAWFHIALRTRKRLLALRLRLEAGLVGVAIVGVFATLVNAYFDPSIESPPVAIWLWTLFGLVLGLAAVSRKLATQRPA